MNENTARHDDQFVEQRTICADNQSIAVGGNIIVTIHVCDLRQLRVEQPDGEALTEELTRELVLQCLARLTAPAEVA